MTRIASPMLVLLIILQAGAAEAVAQPVPEQVRVVWTSSPQTDAVVSWTTREVGATHTVHLDSASRSGIAADYAVHQPADQLIEGTRETAGAPTVWFHHAHLTGLTPGQTVWFAVESDSTVSAEFHFIAAPDTDTTVRIINGGDSRSDPANRRLINQRIAALADDDTILAVVHGGDYVANGRDLLQWDYWLTDHELSVAADGRILPLVPARGNHEATGPQYDEIFASPGGGIEQGNRFTTMITPEVLLLTLNTNISHGGDQRDFMLGALNAATNIRWQLANYHRPAWPAVKTPGNAKIHWVPLFEHFGVDLVLESDGHSLKRTVPIRDDRIDADGVTYIGEGGFGVAQRSPDTSRWYLQSPGFATASHHVIVLTFGPTTLDVEFLDETGAPVDSHQLTARSRPFAVGDPPGPVVVEAGTRSGCTASIAGLRVSWLSCSLLVLIVLLAIRLTTAGWYRRAARLIRSRAPAS